MLLEVADLSSVAVSPDGHSVAFRQEQASVERNTYDTQWLVQTLDGEATVRRIADGGSPLRYDFGGAISEPPQWSADSVWFYYRALLGAEIQVWRAARDGSHVEQVTHDAADVESFALSQDGRSLIYVVGLSREAIRKAEEEEYDQGIRIDCTVPIGQGLFRSGYVNGRLASQRMSGDWMDRRGLLAGKPEHRQVVDLATFSTRDATDADDEAFASRLPVATLKADTGSPFGAALRVRSASSGALAFAQLTGTGMALRVTANAASTSSIQCTAIPCQDAYLAALAWRPGYEQVIFTTVDHDRGRAQTLYVWDVARGDVRPIIHAAGLIGGGRGNGAGEACSFTAEFAVCVTAAAGIPPRLERINLTTGTHQVLYDPNRSLTAAGGPPPRFMRWADSQGQFFTGQFFPAVKKPGVRAPLFITYYACSGFLRGGAGDEWPLASLAGAGIAALCINEPRRDLLHLDQLARYQTALAGIRGAINFLHEPENVDAARVGLGGLSFGSEVTLWVAMHSDLLKAASVTSTSVTPTYYRFHQLQGAQFLTPLKNIWGLGAPEETPDRWKLISPVFNVDKIHTPLLMQMPEQEYLQVLDYFMPLMSSATPTELYVFPNEPHQKYQPRHKLAAYERNLDWFRFWLQDYIDPEPLKAQQYDRWQAMKVRAREASQPADSPQKSAPPAR
jgi:hypothetical protein